MFKYLIGLNIFLIYCTVFILSIDPVFGQTICKLSDIDSKIETCLNGPNNAYDIINANSLVKDVLDKLNLNRINFVVKICPSINNCLATIYENQNYILIDINWLYSIKKEKNDWFLLQVLAHEMGHHLLNHTLKNADNLSQSRLQELEADEFSGYVLGLYGASIFDIKVAIGNIPKNDNNNSTHPINQLREKAVINGYNSSMNNNKNFLLNKITCNTDFSLNNYQNIIFEARNSFDKFISINDNYWLNYAINKYKEAIRFKKDIDLVYELAYLHYINRDFEQYRETILYLYEVTNDKRYLFEIIGNEIALNLANKESDIKKYCDLLNQEVDVTIVTPECYNGIMVYNSYKNRKEFLIGNTNNLFATKINKYAKLIIEINKKQDYYKLAIAHNSMGLKYLLEEDFLNAKSSFIYARDNYIKLLDNQEFFNNNEFSNLAMACQYNLILSLIKNREWSFGLKQIEYYEQLKSKFKLNDELTLIEQLSDINYFKGRCFYGIGNIVQAIDSYTNSIILDKNNYECYFYRGIAYISNNQTDNACDDFEYACKNNYHNACNRYNYHCK